MKNISIYFVLLLSICFAMACSGTRNSALLPKPYAEGQKELYDTIVRMDSILFHAYNTCDTVTYASLFSEDFEFYHDKGGLERNKKASVDSYKKYVCGRVTRELLKGSIEVSPVPNHGAIEIGMHRFYNNQQKAPAEHRYARFIIVWKKENALWKITRVISLH